MVKKILIADDDRAIAELIADALSDEGFSAFCVHDGEECIRAVENAAENGEEFSLIILDVMMPGTDGLEVCRKIRDVVSCPIIFVSAKNRTLDTLVGLGMGADDYISKPFALDELTARVKAHVRRDERARAVKQSEVIKVGSIELNKDTFKVTKNGEKISLSSREFQLLCYFMENEGKTLSKENIFSAVWGVEYGDIGTVAVNIKNLRNKIDIENRYILTVWGAGYKFVDPAGEDI